jgi:hypothetical protein
MAPKYKFECHSVNSTDGAKTDAFLDNALEQATQHVAIGKAPMPVLGKGRTVRHPAF